MSDGLYKMLDADVSAIPAAEIRGSNDRERTMKLLAHVFLRLWTRMAIETGKRLRLTPSQFVLGSYDGQMRWVLSASVDFMNLADIELGTTIGRRHSLVGETYAVRNDERVRLVFSLEEEQVKAQSLMVNYLVYDEALKGFEAVAAMNSLKPAMPAWISTIAQSDAGPLWTYCKDNLECVGI